MLGQMGFSLSSSSSGSTSQFVTYTKLYSTLIEPLVNTFRSNGFSVRCVQELAVMLLSVFSLPLSLG